MHRAMIYVAALSVPWCAMAQDDVTEPLEPAVFVFTEPVQNSDIPVDITLLETVDGLYTPIGIRKPPGKGPLPYRHVF